MSRPMVPLKTVPELLAATLTSFAVATTLTKAVQELFATTLIGFAVSTTIYGINVLQSYIYFRNKSKDHPFWKVTIAGLLVLDTLSSLLIAHSLYTYTILDFENVLEDLIIPWSFCLESVLVPVISIVVQSCFAYQLWRFSHNMALVAAIGLFAAASFVLNIWVAARLFVTRSTIAFLATRSIMVIIGLVQGFGDACDVLITAGLCYYLYRARTGIRTTENIINSLMIYSINRGVLVAVCQIMYLVLFVVFPFRTIWIPFHQVLAKLYVTSLLATLNARDSLHGHPSDCCCQGYGFKTFHISRLEHGSERTDQAARELEDSNLSIARDGPTYDQDSPRLPDLRSLE